MSPYYRRDRSQANRQRQMQERKRALARRGGGRSKGPGVLRRAARLFKVLVVLAIVGGVALLYHFHHLDGMIEEKFDRPRKWDLPSRVFSDAEYLYPGLDIKARSIASKLDRLDYRNTGQEIKGPGEYSLTDSRLLIHLHDFDYPDDPFKGFPLEVGIEGGTIRQMKRMDTGEALEIARLEPEQVASIFNEKMEDRTPVALSDVPENLVRAIILIEDERFFEHGGVDPVGIARAALANLKALRIVQGGSTLTQQLVKNFFLYPKRSFARKLNEMLIAWRIEKKHSKGEILEAYLNEIYLGQRGSASVSGVEEASRLYFGKAASQLTAGECAMIAGMIKSPSLYNPIANPEKARERRDFVLAGMRDKGFITAEEQGKAKKEKIVTPRVRTRTVVAPYFIDFLKRQLADLYPPDVLKTEGLRIFTTLDMFMQLAAERAVSQGIASLERDYATRLPREHEGGLQACLVAVQPSTGYLRALVGGRDYADTQFDRCTQAMRQPGSVFKPFVYLTAMDPARSRALFTPASLVDDTSFSVRSGGKDWSPANYDKKEHGPVTLRRALEQSYNIASAKLAIEAGLENVVKTARDAGIESELMAVPSMALGAFEVTPMEMASAYTIFPNGGIRADPVSIINVVTKEGEVLEKKSLVMKREFEAGPVFLTTSVMKGVLDSGTGAGARSRGFTAIAAGKTGTTSSYRDAWFVGFTPKLLALSWVGYDDNATMNLSGASGALPIWTKFMNEVRPNGDGDFSGPSGVILVKIDPVTGGLSDSSCPGGRFEVFIKGTEPEKTCSEIGTDASARETAPMEF
ncbi:MAG: PBP1A family penicillin-binding protein [Proteobacteria bacterium]|nr:PBP1A family penicillin-binding protein [Pseudomonadota bacterium]